MISGCGKLHDEELHNLYSLPSIIWMVKSRRLRCAGNVARMKKRNTYRILVRKSEGRRSLGRTRRMWIVNIKMDLRDNMGWCELDWSGTE
jgi:hypothetical protein